MLLVIWIHLLPKLSGLGSLLNALKRFTWISRRHVNEGKVDFCIVQRIFKNEIYSDHRRSPFSGSAFAILPDEQTPNSSDPNHDG